MDRPEVRKRKRPPHSGALDGQLPLGSDGLEAEFGDLANATRLVAVYGDVLLYCAALGGWHRWDGQRYKRCRNGEELLVAQHVARLLMAEAVAVLSTAKEAHTAAAGAEAAKALGELEAARRRVSSAAKVQSAGRLRAMLNVAAPRLAVDPNDIEHITQRAALPGCADSLQAAPWCGRGPAE